MNKLKKDESLFILQPSVFNAIIPIFVKNLFYALIIGVVGLGLFWLLMTFGTVDYTINQAFIVFLIFTIGFPLIPLILKLIILYNTKYIFYRTHVLSEFELMYVRRHSTPYHQIVNITSKVSIWDRLCHAGDVTMHTAEDRLPDLTLYYIKNPQEIETKLYNLIRHYKIRDHKTKPLTEENEFENT